MLVSLFFVAFSLGVIGFCLCSVFSKNNVHAVLWLVCAFFCASWMYIFFVANFLAMLLIIVYVGAIATLFLFVVMMTNFSINKRNLISTLIALVFIIVAVAIFSSKGLTNFDSQLIFQNNFVEQKQSDTQILGLVVYTKYFGIFQICGLILFATMVGVIHLISSSGAMQNNGYVRKQSISTQVSRKTKDCLEIVKNVKIGHGLDI